MAIEYTYEIINVSADNDVMEIKYTAPGYPDVVMGAPLPREDEALEDIVRAFSPVVRWDYVTQKVVPPRVGATGVLSADTPSEMRAAIKLEAERAQDEPVFQVGGMGEGVRRV